MSRGYRAIWKDGKLLAEFLDHFPKLHGCHTGLIDGVEGLGNQLAVRLDLLIGQGYGSGMRLVVPGDRRRAAQALDNLDVAG